MKKLTAVFLTLVIVLTMAFTVSAAGTPKFTYQLQLTDNDGMTVTNPRSLSNGDTLYVEIVLTRTDVSSSYDMFGIEFRLLTQGLKFNNDGTTLRSGTQVREMNYSSGTSVGFAWYDMQQTGERTNNPVLAGSWSYTVTDASRANISVPVALVYVTGHTGNNVPTGSAQLNLEIVGGVFLDENVSGSYVSGTVVTLPNMEQPGYTFVGWSDGSTIYPPGSEYVITGIVTLTAQWEELERNRYLSLDASGGEVIGEDITGYYADGMIVVLPDAKREGYDFLGWTDGVKTYNAGDEYTVYNTVTIVALWEESSAEPVDEGFGLNCIICGRDYWVIPAISICWICLLILILILNGIWLIILLWKRRFVKYSLVNGDIELNYKNDEHDVQVEVVLIDEDRKHSLNNGEPVKAKDSLRFIKNTMHRPVVAVKPGKYKGELIIRHDEAVEVRKCCIQTLDKELEEK